MKGNLKRRIEPIIKIIAGIMFSAGIILIIIDVVSADSVNHEILKNVSVFDFAVAVILVKIYPSRPNMGRKKIIKIYKKQWGEYIDNAFRGRRTLKKRLEKAICFLHNERYAKSLKVLDSLYERCETPEDYCAVLLFMALCCQRTGDTEKRIEAYEEILRYNSAQPDIWLYLGLAYLDNKDYENYGRCNQCCLMYDSQNANAYANMGSYYLYTGKPERAVENCLRAISLDNKLYQAMGFAASAYCLMGDMANCERYRRMYAENGGNSEEINNRIKILRSIKM